MHKNIEIVIGRLATDPEILARFADQPDAVLRGQGLELTEIEIAALAATDPRAFRSLAEALDARLRKASLATGRHDTDVDITEPHDADVGITTITTLISSTTDSSIPNAAELEKETTR